jgi:hypothetical protein
MNHQILSDNDVVFILPCAGVGRRLGWSGHKELFPVFPNIKLIDYSLNHIRINALWLKHHLHRKTRVAVVIRPEKADVAEYVRKQLPDLQVDTVYFNTALKEWPGSVHSAHSLYGDCNIVLLPDTYLSLGAQHFYLDSDRYPITYHVLRCLRSHSVVFGCLPCTAPAALKRFGAVHITQAAIPVIQAFQDKPDSELNRYNGFWCCYAFTANAGESLYQFLRRSVLHQPADIREESFSPAAVFPVREYHDLGTPESIDMFRNRFCQVSNSDNNSLM